MSKVLCYSYEIGRCGSRESVHSAVRCGTGSLQGPSKPSVSLSQRQRVVVFRPPGCRRSDVRARARGEVKISTKSPKQKTIPNAESRQADGRTRATWPMSC